MELIPHGSHPPKNAVIHGILLFSTIGSPQGWRGIKALILYDAIDVKDYASCLFIEALQAFEHTSTNCINLTSLPCNQPLGQWYSRYWRTSALPPQPSVECECRLRRLLADLCWNTMIIWALRSCLAWTIIRTSERMGCLVSKLDEQVFVPVDITQYPINSSTHSV